MLVSRPETIAMILYDPKNWLGLLFSLRGTVLPVIWPRLVFLGVLAVLVASYSTFFSRLEEVNPLGHTLTGVVVGFLIVLRTNTAYDRHWEGRKLWGGIVNSSRNLVRQAAAFTGRTDELASLVSAYAIALKQYLRRDKDLTELSPWLPDHIYEEVIHTDNPPLAVAESIAAWIQRRLKAGDLDSVTAVHLDERVRELIDLQGGCERILKTPIPFNYAVHIKQFLMLYLVTLPFVLVRLVGWLAVPMTLVVSFGLIGIEEAGVEVEDPFGTDPNDLPLESFCFTIARDTASLVVQAKHADEKPTN
jgi:putative membrane protein